ncbi:MAG: DUF3526 domain-containing protein [Beijerinckiaceae bacterium]|nr:DUF3526 domain-containing protein [Beijerinckiaceae bacterium]MCI0735845.1 DUF3526 domain-containing protein [Beijerinckiaceae bacterium]
MIWVIARKEIIELCRDRRLQVSVSVLWLFIICGAAFGTRLYLVQSAQAHAAAEAERQRWLGQGEKHPHLAAHYGVFAFRTPRPLSIVDSGVESYLGTTIWLEAHKQNETLYRPAEDAAAYQRFGDLTIAAAMQTLIPLLIIVLGFAAFTGERERGTLRQLLSLGIRPRDLLLGKALAIGAILLAVCLPALGLAIVAIVSLAPGEYLLDELARGVLMAGVYSAYLGGFIFLTLAVSAFCRSSRAALVSLLAFWAFSTLILPRTVSDMAKALYPTGAGLEIRHALEANLQEANGEDAWARRKAALPAQFNVSRIDDLPFDYYGLELQDGEERAYPVYDQHYNSAFDVLRSQDQLYQLATLLAPVTGVQLISMALSGTDTGTYRDFFHQSEAARRKMQEKINDGIREFSVRDEKGDWEAKASRELWERIPAVAYFPPAWWQSLAPYWPALVLLALWSSAAFAAALVESKRINPV